MASTPQFDSRRDFVCTSKSNRSLSVGVSLLKRAGEGRHIFTVLQLDRASMRIPHKINLLSLQKGLDRFETGYGLLSRSRFDSECVPNEKHIFTKSDFEKSLTMHFFLLARTLN